MKISGTWSAWRSQKTTRVIPYLIVLATVLQEARCVDWFEDLNAKIKLNLLGDKDVDRFEDTRYEGQNFKVIFQDNDRILVGGRDEVHILSLDDLYEYESIKWSPPSDHQTLCLLKQMSEEECHNYIKLVSKNEVGNLLLCGTNAFKPLYREYTKNNGTYTLIKSSSGQALCSYDPSHSSTALYTDGSLYSGTGADFIGDYDVVYRHQRTLITDKFHNQLNDPSFVKTVEYEDYVFFFFREIALEHIICGNTRYSRVGRVCKRDNGGPGKYRDNWTSFLKSTLFCSAPGDFAFHFNEMQSTTDIVMGALGAHVVYAVFTTPPHSIPGSAVCAFSMEEIQKSFNSSFKENIDLDTKWLPVPESKVPEPRPGTCINDSQSLSMEWVDFIQSHPLMDDVVDPMGGHPLALTASNEYRFTQIVVDPAVVSWEGTKYDVLFLGTDDGRVFKMTNMDFSAEVIEDLQVLRVGVSIDVLKIVDTPYQEPRLIVLSDRELASISLHRCEMNGPTCNTCVGLRDPYCAWNLMTKVCEANFEKRSIDHIQNMRTGKSDLCPDDPLEDRFANRRKQGRRECRCAGRKKERPEGGLKSRRRPRNETWDCVRKENWSPDPSTAAGYGMRTLVVAVCGGCLGAIVGAVFACVCAWRFMRDRIF